MLAEILINRPSKHLDRTFTYRVPDIFGRISPGWRVIVPFSGRTEEGIVLSLREEGAEPLSYKVRDIAALVDDFPWFTPEMLALARWISLYYLCTYIDALRLFLIDKKGIRTEISYTLCWDKIPEGHRLRELLAEDVERLSEEDAALALGEEIVRDALAAGFLQKTETAEAVYHVPLERWARAAETLPADFRPERSKKQAALWDFLHENGPHSAAALAGAGFSASVLRDFCKKGLGQIFYRAKDTFSLIEKTREDIERTLTAEQQAAFTRISSAIDSGKPEGILLMGVTGSGKTEVYLRAAEYARRQGGSVLILVPEIALTTQMVDYFSARFGDDVVFLHSQLSKGERYNNRTRVAEGKSRIVIGSRSAIFLPFQNLRLVIVDEEYDNSYKQDETPRYNGRDAAKKLAALHRCPIVLGAATPSVVTYAAAEAGKISLIEMKERVHHTPLPKIYTVDLKNRDNLDQDTIYTRELTESIRAMAAEGKKTILFLNRRGFATSLLCEDCGYAFKCPNCDVSLVYHKMADKLKCHYCECVFPRPARCPKCGGVHIAYTGRGTERAEEQLEEILPEISCARLDLDSTSRKHSSAKILADFRAGKFNVLLGTQMVTKGHDIEGVQLVGILSADSLLNMPTYLAAEEAFTLITQCAGRAGRGKERGAVILQTHNPEHYVVLAAQSQDYLNFYRQEIRYRQAFRYPPFSRLMKITCFSKQYAEAKNRARDLHAWFLETLPRLPVRAETTPPYDEPIKKIRNTYFVSLTVKGESLVDLKALMREEKLFQQNGIIIDVDPIN